MRVEVSWPFAFVIFGVVLVSLGVGFACYKGDLGYGGPDYPPLNTKDAGPG